MEKKLTSARHHAMLFAFLAKETLAECGEKAHDVLLEGVKRYGEQRGRRMARRAQADGQPLTVASYLAYGEWVAEPGDMDLRFPAYSPEVNMRNYQCPWYEEWAKRQLLDYGWYYCAVVDAAIARGFREDLVLDILEMRVKGEECCNFYFRQSQVSDEEQLKLGELRDRLGSRARMDWAYHTGHLFKTMKQAITGVFGAKGETAVTRALEAYEAEYGSKARKLVEEYEKVDYDVLPPYEGIR